MKVRSTLYEGHGDEAYQLQAGKDPARGSEPANTRPWARWESAQRFRRARGLAWLGATGLARFAVWGIVGFVGTMRESLGRARLTAHSRRHPQASVMKRLCNAVVWEILGRTVC